MTGQDMLDQLGLATIPRLTPSDWAGQTRLVRWGGMPPPLVVVQVRLGGKEPVTVVTLGRNKRWAGGFRRLTKIRLGHKTGGGPRLGLWRLKGETRSRPGLEEGELMNPGSRVD